MSEPTGFTDLAYTGAIAIGIALLLSIMGASCGLLTWLERSRRETRQRTGFVSSVSHEFKTPLTTIRLYTDLLLENRIPDKAKRTQYLHIIQQESHRLARLVHNVLDFSRLEMNKHHLNPERFSATEALQETLNPLVERFRDQKMALTFPHENLSVFADRDGFQQIVLNLCDNALKYAAEGGRLDISGIRNQHEIIFRFSDNGPGISPAQQKQLFQAFQQASNRLEQTRGGCGLGLHISARLAQNMGGSLQYKPQPCGACFEWRVPASPLEK